MAANYELTTDNLMDLSHTAFLHEGLLGNEHTVRGEVSVRQEGNAVIVSRYNRNVPVVAVHDLSLIHIYALGYVGADGAPKRFPKRLLLPALSLIHI